MIIVLIVVLNEAQFFLRYGYGVSKRGVVQTCLLCIRSTLDSTRQPLAWSEVKERKREGV